MNLSERAHDALLRERTRQIAKMVNPAAFETTVHCITELGPTDGPGIVVMATIGGPFPIFDEASRFFATERLDEWLVSEPRRNGKRSRGPSATHGWNPT